MHMQTHIRGGICISSHPKTNYTKDKRDKQMKVFYDLGEYAKYPWSRMITRNHGYQTQLWEMPCLDSPVNDADGRWPRRKVTLGTRSTVTREQRDGGAGVRQDLLQGGWQMVDMRGTDMQHAAAAFVHFRIFYKLFCCLAPALARRGHGLVCVIPLQKTANSSISLPSCSPTCCSWWKFRQDSVSFPILISSPSPPLSLTHTQALPSRNFLTVKSGYPEAGSAIFRIPYSLFKEKQKPWPWEPVGRGMRETNLHYLPCCTRSTAH